MSLKYNFVEPTRQDGMSTNVKQFAFYHIFDLAWPFLLNQTFERQRKREEKKFEVLGLLLLFSCWVVYDSLWPHRLITHQFSSVAQSCLTLCNPVNRSMPGLPVHHQLPESTQTHVHQVGDAIQPSHPLSSPSPPAPNLSQHQGLSQWVSNNL